MYMNWLYMCSDCLGIYQRPGVNWRPAFIRDPTFIRTRTSETPVFIRGRCLFEIRYLYQKFYGTTKC